MDGALEGQRAVHREIGEARVALAPFGGSAGIGRGSVALHEEARRAEQHVRVFPGGCLREVDAARHVLVSRYLEADDKSIAAGGADLFDDPRDDPSARRDIAAPIVGPAIAPR